jgi:pyruvate dehydrogenase E1 component alpha subunit
MTARKKKTSALAGHDGSPLITNEKLLALYAALLQCRMLERHVRTLRGTRHKAAFGNGHESQVVAAVTVLGRGDAVCPPPGAITPCLVKGVPVQTILAWLGTETAPQRDAARRVIAPGADLISQLKAAQRTARLMRKAKSGKAAVLFCKGTQIMRGQALDLLCSAAAERLPILFVCDGESTKQDLAAKAYGHGLPGIPVDGHDVVAIYRVASEALAHARHGNGPTLIDCKPWPVGKAKKHDAVSNMEEYLLRKGLFSAQQRAEVKARFARELKEAARR